jgi:hypothetical protein
MATAIATITVASAVVTVASHTVVATITVSCHTCAGWSSALRGGLDWEGSENRGGDSSVAGGATNLSAVVKI